MSTLKSIAVVGGGISGLAAALRLRELRPDLAVTLFEASGRLGGVLDTVTREGYLFECGADGFITDVPWGLDFCKRVGLGDDLVGTDPSRRRAYVVRRGRLEIVPDGFIVMAPRNPRALLASRILSPWGKLRMACEYFLPPRQAQTDESLGAFVTRRLGREVYERLVQPLIGGIYTGDPMQLSLAATMPRFATMEREHGGLIRGARKAQRAKSPDSTSGARYGMFAAPRRGFKSLIEAAAAQLPAGTVRLNTRVRRIERAGERGPWRLQIGDAAAETFDGVIVAAQAFRAAELLAAVLPALEKELNDIVYAGTAVVSCAYRRTDVGHALDGFGFVTPAIENRVSLAGSFLSQKYPGRAPDGGVLIRVFVGGAMRPELLQKSDAELMTLVHAELRTLLSITGEPVMQMISRWDKAMPQYRVGHLERVRHIEELVKTLPRLELAGNAYHGVGVPLSIHSGDQAAKRVLAGLG